MRPIFADKTIVRLLLILVLTSAVFFFIDFLVPVLAALIICIASWPLYQKLVRLCQDNTLLAATLALLAILLGLVIPLVLALSYTFKELKLLVDWLMRINQEGWPAPQWMLELPGIGDWIEDQWVEWQLAEPHKVGELITFFTGEHLGGISRWVLALSSNAAGLLLTTLFMLITIFFIYKDGTAFLKQLDLIGERLLPVRWIRFSRVIPAAISSTVIGMGLIAIGEGVVLGIAYWIAGLSSPVILGVVTAFMALIPGGAPLTFTLVSVYLVGSGETMAGMGLFMWGSFELFIVDKTLRPKLVGGPIKLPFLPTFFGLVGGVKTMGIVGLFIGPVLMALLVAIWREWISEESADDPPSSQS